MIPAPANWSGPARLIATSTKSAEIIKHASNAFLATKISFINAVSNICEAVGADVKEVCEGIGSDSRIGSRFLNPGIGYGGSCFPKDLKAFRHVARENGYDFNLLSAVIAINEEQRLAFFVKFVPRSGPSRVRNSLFLVWRLRAAQMTSGNLLRLKS